MLSSLLDIFKKLIEEYKNIKKINDANQGMFGYVAEGLASSTGYIKSKKTKEDEIGNTNLKISQELSLLIDLLPEPEKDGVKKAKLVKPPLEKSLDESIIDQVTRALVSLTEQAEIAKDGASIWNTQYPDSKLAWSLHLLRTYIIDLILTKDEYVSLKNVFETKISKLREELNGHIYRIRIINEEQPNEEEIKDYKLKLIQLLSMGDYHTITLHIAAFDAQNASQSILPKWNKLVDSQKNSWNENHGIKFSTIIPFCFQRKFYLAAYKSIFDEKNTTQAKDAFDAFIQTFEPEAKKPKPN